MLSAKCIADVVFDEFARFGIHVDVTMLCYAIDMMERVRVPADVELWRRVVRDELRVFSSADIAAVYERV